MHLHRRLGDADIGGNLFVQAPRRDLNMTSRSRELSVSKRSLSARKAPSLSRRARSRASPASTVSRVEPRHAVLVSLAVAARPARAALLWCAEHQRAPAAQDTTELTRGSDQSSGAVWLYEGLSARPLASLPQKRALSISVITRCPFGYCPKAFVKI